MSYKNIQLFKKKGGVKKKALLLLFFLILVFHVFLIKLFVVRIVAKS